jgi:Fe-S-cluster containining protein
MELRGRDGPLLSALKAFVRLSSTLSRMIRRRRAFSRWRLEGDCNGCGVCCERPSVMVDGITWKEGPWRRAFLWWMRTVNGMELVDARTPRVLAFQCSYFDRNARKCTNYESRPAMCRDYPNVLLEQSSPQFYAECGYRAVARNSRNLLRILDRAQLDEARKEELKRKLRVE